jgi:hypothetical protein
MAGGGGGVGGGRKMIARFATRQACSGAQGEIGWWLYGSAL